MRAEFIEVGHRLAEKVVSRLMSEASLVARSSRKRRKYNSYSGEFNPTVGNVVNRNFRASAPSEKCLIDISEFQIPAGKVYLSPIVDCVDGLIVSSCLGKRPTGDLVNNMLDGVMSKLAQNERPIVHSDRGTHYRWPGWIERTEQFCLTRSMSRKGCSPDNAACEAFFGRLKTDFFYPRDWRYASVDYLMSELNAYIEWYNTKRIKMSLGSKSPVNYRKELGIFA
jgi:transposase InsO family protein